MLLSSSPLGVRGRRGNGPLDWRCFRQPEWAKHCDGRKCSPLPRCPDQGNQIGEWHPQAPYRAMRSCSPRQRRAERASGQFLNQLEEGHDRIGESGYQVEVVVGVEVVTDEPSGVSEMDGEPSCVVSVSGEDDQRARRGTEARSGLRGLVVRRAAKLLDDSFGGPCGPGVEPEGGSAEGETDQD